MKKFGFIKKTTMITLAIASTVIFTISAGAAVDYSSNINYTGGYDCSPNTKGAITISKEKIGVMAFMTDMNFFIRATTSVGGITSECFTATFTKPAKCDIEGNFLDTRFNGNIIVQGDVDIYGQWLFGEKYIKISNRGKKVNNQQQTFIKPYSRHYY